MRVAAVERPTTLDALLDRIDGLGGVGRLIAGGTALVPELRARPDSGDLVLLSLDAVAELAGSSADGVATMIGAGTRLADLERDPALLERFPALQQCLTSLATPRIREMATVGGALAQRDAGYDLPVVLAALGGTVRLRSREGSRESAVAALWPDEGGDSGMRPGEVITDLVLPHHLEERSAFVKLSPRTGTDRAILSAAATLRLQPDGRCAWARVVLGGLGPRLVLSTQVEERLPGLLREDVAEAVRSIAVGTSAPSDVRASSEYRRVVAPIVTRRALLAAWTQD